MAAASAALLLDPLAEESPQPTNAVTSRRPASAKHGETVAPELAGCLAGRAVAAVRALGLIAAIEGLDTSDAGRHGVVVEQDPPAGTRLGRDGIVVLRIGQPAGELADDERAVLEESPADVGLGGAEDDTEAWFATLGPTLGGPVTEPGASAPRRRRKHRRAPVPVEHMVFDTPPNPLPPTCDPLSEGHRDLSPGPFTSVLASLLVRLPARSVSPTWRGRALVLAGAILGLVVFTRGGWSHSHHQGFAPLAQAPTSRPRVVALPASPPVRSRPAAGRLPRGRARHGTPRRAPREPIVASVSASAPHAAVTLANAAPPTRVSPTTRPGESASQFSYLGQ
jgi:hypothetical protein